MHFVNKGSFGKQSLRKSSEQWMIKDLAHIQSQGVLTNIKSRVIVSIGLYIECEPHKYYIYGVSLSKDSFSEKIASQQLIILDITLIFSPMALLQSFRNLFSKSALYLATKKLTVSDNKTSNDVNNLIFHLKIRITITVARWQHIVTNIWWSSTSGYLYDTSLISSSITVWGVRILYWIAWQISW